jgi:CBS domain-containing protein
MPAVAATKLLLEKGVTCLPVVDERGRLIGIVTWRDLLTRCIDDSCRIDQAA